MSCLMAELFGLPKENIVPDYSIRNDVPQLRPINAMLDTTSSFKIVNNFEPNVKFSDALTEALQKFF